MPNSVPRADWARLPMVVLLLFLPTLPALSAEGIGWRTDGSGCYPRAQPPLEWSTTKNVVWKTAMPGYGVSYPVLLGQRVFICSDPSILLCLKKSDGNIIWQKNSSYDELEIAADVREKLKVELAEEV